MGATVRYRAERGAWYVFTHRRGRRTSIRCESEQQAHEVAEATNARHEAHDRYLSELGMTVGIAAQGWLEDERPALSLSYAATADALVRLHLVPRLGSLPLEALGRPVLLRFVDDTLASGKSSATALNALSLLRRACQRYVEAGLLATNPCARVGALVAQVARRYEPEVRRADAWTHEEAAALLELARAHEPRVYGPLLCALHTGMRRGEVLGLDWPDVGSSRITVRRALVRGRSKAPKSGKAREVPISPRLRACFDELRARERTERAWKPVGPVFLAAGGERWDENNFGRAWRRVQKLAVKAEIRPLRFHDARHTFASWALEGGRSIKWVQESLGHASAELTLRTYAHLMPRERDELDFLGASGAHPGRTQALPEGRQDAS